MLRDMAARWNVQTQELPLSEKTSLGQSSVRRTTSAATRENTASISTGKDKPSIQATAPDFPRNTHAHARSATSSSRPPGLPASTQSPQLAKRYRQSWG